MAFRPGRTSDSREIGVDLARIRLKPCSRGAEAALASALLPSLPMKPAEPAGFECFDINQVCRSRRSISRYPRVKNRVEDDTATRLLSLGIASLVTVTAPRER
jgi:hypothetical protein